MSTPDRTASEPPTPADAPSPAPETKSGRIRTLGPVLGFDVIGPIAVYYMLVAAGLLTVPALILSGAVPAAGIAIGVARDRRLAALRSRRPMIFRFALEGMGRDTPKGRGFADRWRYPAFRRSFRVVTVVWGIMFIAEAATQAVIIQ